MGLRRLRCAGLCACGAALVVLEVPSLRFMLASQAGLAAGVESPHHSALEYSLERGGSTDISRAARNGVCYLLLASIASLATLLVATQKSGMNTASSEFRMQ